MTVFPQRLLVPALLVSMAASAGAQTLLARTGAALLAPQSLQMDDPVSLPLGDGAQQLVGFKDADVKFSVPDLMNMLRDHRHEGWVLAAYPDPDTRRPLIGAGFSLDIPAREHPQLDPLNPHPFVEPSSDQLWQAAGLAPERLQEILEQYDHDVNTWSSRTYRKKIYRQTLRPQLSDEEATRLLRISVVQAIYNARGYCRSFDQLTGAQQMALTQLVFQMGTNLQQFVGFLSIVNDPDGSRELSRLDGYIEGDTDHWKSVQQSLMDSQWARKYTIRAASVIALFDPAYSREPGAAELRIASILHPPVEHLQRKGRPAATLRLASYSKRPAKGRGRKPSRPQVKRKLT